MKANPMISVGRVELRVDHYSKAAASFFNESTIEHNSVCERPTDQLVHRKARRADR